MTESDEVDSNIGSAVRLQKNQCHASRSRRAVVRSASTNPPNPQCWRSQSPRDEASGLNGPNRIRTRCFRRATARQLLPETGNWSLEESRPALRRRPDFARCMFERGGPAELRAWHLRRSGWIQRYPFRTPFTISRRIFSLGSFLNRATKPNQASSSVCRRKRSGRK